MTAYGADEAAVAGVLAASLALVAIATRSLGAGGGGDHDRPVPGAGGAGVAGPQRMTDLAVALGVVPSTAGRMCDRLVRKGLIQRTQARTDRRSVHVSITAAGRLVVGEAAADEIPDSRWPADGQAVLAPGRPEPVRASADVRR